MALAKLPDLLDLLEGTPGQADFERFVSDAHRRGLNYSQSMRELAVRTVFARLRREASDAVAMDIENWQAILDAAVQKCLADNPEHSHELMAMMQGLSYAYVLYPHEVRMVDAKYERLNPRHLSIDQMAALRVEK
ncbi:hypothetical protein NKI61_31345 [Mesorhizobium sp. M0514]|uniref:hypothetical protein n=1 Tax=Mesorhizobium sp. M0514 TaxID=2956955 RepID=UPI0033363F77